MKENKVELGSQVKINISVFMDRFRGIAGEDRSSIKSVQQLLEDHEDEIGEVTKVDHLPDEGTQTITVIFPSPYFDEKTGNAGLGKRNFFPDELIVITPGAES